MSTNRILSYANDGTTLSARSVVDIDISGLSINSVPMGASQAITSDGAGNVGFTNISALPYALPSAQFYIAASTNLNAAAINTFTLVQDVNNVPGLSFAGSDLTFANTGTYLITAQYSYTSITADNDFVIAINGGSELSRVRAAPASSSLYQSCIRVNSASENIRFRSIRNGVDATAMTSSAFNYSCLIFVVKLS